MCHANFPDCSKNEKITLSSLMGLGSINIEKLIPKSFGSLVPMKQFGSILWKESF